MVPKCKPKTSNKENIHMQMDKAQPASSSKGKVLAENEQKINQQLKFVNHLYEILENLASNGEFFRQVPQNLTQKVKSLLLKHALIRCENIYSRQFILQKNILCLDNWDEFMKTKSFLKIKLALKGFIDRIASDYGQCGHLDQELENQIKSEQRCQQLATLPQVDRESHTDLGSKGPASGSSALQSSGQAGLPEHGQSVVLNKLSIETMRQFLLEGNNIMIQYFQALKENLNQSQAQSILNTFQQIVEFHNQLLSQQNTDAQKKNYRQINDKVEQEVDRALQPSSLGLCN